MCLWKSYLSALIFAWVLSFISSLVDEDLFEFLDCRGAMMKSEDWCEWTGIEQLSLNLSPFLYILCAPHMNKHVKIDSKCNCLAHFFRCATLKQTSTLSLNKIVSHAFFLMCHTGTSMYILTLDSIHLFFQHANHGNSHQYSRKMVLFQLQAQVTKEGGFHIWLCVLTC